MRLFILRLLGFKTEQYHLTFEIRGEIKVHELTESRAKERAMQHLNQLFIINDAKPYYVDIGTK